MAKLRDVLECIYKVAHKEGEIGVNSMKAVIDDAMTDIPEPPKTTDGICCPRCTIIFHDEDIRKNPMEYTTCGHCFTIQHKKCIGDNALIKELGAKPLEKLDRKKIEELLCGICGYEKLHGKKCCGECSTKTLFIPAICQKFGKEKGEKK